MAVVARFYVQTSAKNAWDPKGRVVTLAPVSRGQHNKSWASATPSGKIELTIQNESAAKWFDDRVAKEVAITFEDRPELCALCSEEVTGMGADVGVEVSEHYLAKLPQLEVGQVAHSRCLSGAWQNSN